MHQLSHVYDDFEPTSEWLSDAEHDTLLVYLPGFRKDQLKVQATSHQKLRILGERPIGENKWSRFRKEFPISSNYDLNQISAKFEKGILHVKHPKKIIATPAAPVAEHHRPAKTSASENPKIEQNNENPPPKINPDNRVADGDASKSAEKDHGVVEEQGEGTNTPGMQGNVGGKCKLGIAKLMAEMKQPRQSVSFVMASLIVLVIGMYAKTTFGFHGEDDN